MCSFGLREVCLGYEIIQDLMIKDHRLKLTLGLPKIQPRPPCPPRIYQKLYKYLDSALTAGACRSGRPARPSGDVGTSILSPAKPRTPVKPMPFKASNSSKRRSRHPNAFVSEVPRWVMPLIRHLCRAFGAPAAPHHVFAGVTSILTLPAPYRADHEGKKASSRQVNVSALVIMVYLLVSTRLSGASIPPEEFVRQRTLAVETIRSSGIDEAVKEVADGSDVVARIMGWGREISSNGWAELDWFANVPEGAGLSLDEGREERDEAPEDGEDDVRPSTSIVKHLDFDEDEDQSILRPGLGTMVCSNLALEARLSKRRCRIESTISASGGSLSTRNGRKVS